MLSCLKIYFSTSLFLLTTFAVGQTFEVPTPKMNKNVMRSFINMHIEYPPKAILNKNEGTVIIDFTTNEKGEVIEARVRNSFSKDIDSSALKLFHKILWNPAVVSGQPIEKESEYKIKYNIGKYKNLVKKRGYDQLPCPFLPIDSSNKIFTVKELEISPSPLLDSIYPSVQEFIAQNLEYPEAANKLSLSGIVKLRFVIETCGLPSNILIIDPVGGGCTEEAIRIAKEMEWKPGIRKNKAVRTCYNLSIKFSPLENLKNKHIPNQSNSGI